MAEWYYVKDGERLGPVDTSTLKSMAVSGQLGPSDLIWREGMGAWMKSSQAKGLFPAMAEVARPAAVAVGTAVAPPPPPPHQATAPQPPPANYASPMQYAPPVTHDAGEHVIRRRSVLPFLIVAGVMFLLGMTMVFLSWFGAPPARWGHEELMMLILGALMFVLVGIGALVMWLFWVVGLHRDLRTLSMGRHDISPGQAVGFSLIPLFDAFWVVYMPWRAAGELNGHLRMAGLSPVSAGAVMGCQIGSIISALFLPGLVPVLYAVSMWQVQNGMNRLADHRARG